MMQSVQGANQVPYLVRCTEPQVGHDSYRNGFESDIRFLIFLQIHFPPRPPNLRSMLGICFWMAAVVSDTIPRLIQGHGDASVSR